MIRETGSRNHACTEEVMCQSSGSCKGGHANRGGALLLRAYVLRRCTNGVAAARAMSCSLVTCVSRLLDSESLSHWWLRSAVACLISPLPKMMAFFGSGRAGFRNVTEDRPRDADGKATDVSQRKAKTEVKLPAPTSQPHGVACTLCKAQINTGARYRCCSCADVGAVS